MVFRLRNVPNAVPEVPLALCMVQGILPSDIHKTVLLPVACVLP